MPEDRKMSLQSSLTIVFKHSLSCDTIKTFLGHICCRKKLVKTELPFQDWVSVPQNQRT